MTKARATFSLPEGCAEIYREQSGYLELHLPDIRVPHNYKTHLS